VSGNSLSLPIQQQTTITSTGSWKVGLGLGVIGVISRWALRGRLLHDHESAGLALAALQGQLPNTATLSPTGWLYILLGRQLIALFDSPEAAFIAIGVVTSGLAIIAMYLLGAALFGETAGILAAMLLISSPLFWFYGASALPYTCDTLIAIVAAWLGWSILASLPLGRMALAIWLALAVGLRPTAALLMTPLAIFATIQAVRVEALRRPQIVASLLAAGICVLVWFAPFGHVSAATLLLGRGLAPGANIGELVRATGWGWALAALPALGALALWLLRIPGFRSSYGRWNWLRSEHFQFFAIWIIPWLLFVCVVPLDSPGQPAIGLPLLLLWSANALVRFIGAGTRRMAIITTTLIMLGNTALFLSTPERPLLGDRLAPSAATIVYHDRRLAAAIVAIRRFSPSETVIVAEDWLPVRYYLPRYALIPYRHDPGQPERPLDVQPTQHDLAREAKALLWFEATLDPYNLSPSETEIQPMTVGYLRMLRPQPAEHVAVDGDGFGLRVTPR